MGLQRLLLCVIISAVAEEVLLGDKRVLIVLVGALAAALNALQCSFQLLGLVGAGARALRRALLCQLAEVFHAGNELVQIIQYHLRQHIMGDIVLAAHGCAVALIRAAGVEDFATPGGLDHGSSTIATLEKTRKGADILLKIRRTGVSVQQSLHPLPLALFDDGLVGAGYYRPLGALLPLGFPVHLKAVVPSLLHVADVHLILQDTVDGSVCPVGGGFQPVVVAVFFAGEPFVLTGAGDALLVQLLGNTDLTHSIFKQGEDAPHHLRRRRVDDQTVMILRVLTVPVAGECSDELAPLLLGVEGAFDLLGDVACILGVKQILQRHHHVVGAAVAVDIVRDSDEPHTVLRQPTLQIAACFDVITAETGQVLYQHTADAPTFHVPQHPLKGGALEIRAGIAVVGIAFRHYQLRMIFDIRLQQLPLVADGITLHPVSVLPGQATVQRSRQ